jgi:hypothetical protein
MTPSSPTAQPWVASVKVREKRSFVVLDVCGVQVTPPLVV